MTFLLHHSALGSAEAANLAFVLHGVLGTGSNFRSLIKELADTRLDWRFILVDLRLHGRSLDAPPPDTLDACALDLVHLSQHLKQNPNAVIGHSFGGKVALAYAKRAPSALRQVWVLDSYPGAHRPDDGNEVVRVIRTLEQVAHVVRARHDFVDSLVERGLSTSISHWLSQNLVREGDHYRFRLDLGRIRELLEDYFAQDYWSMFRDPPPHQELHLVVAERSRRLNDEARARLSEYADQKRVHRYTLPNAGHWLHVDNPQGLIELLSRNLA